MKTLVRIFLLTLILGGCKGAETYKNPIASASIAESKSDTPGVTADPTVVDILVISENSLGEISLPFLQQDMLAPLMKAFDRYSVTKEIGQQDGPDFSLYSIRKGELELAYFEMDWENALELNAVYVKDPFIKDQYGLAVGDSFEQIQALRGGLIKTRTNFHEHTYAYLDGSNIIYEIDGDATMPTITDREEPTYTNEQLIGWRIQQIIWRNQFVDQ